MLAAMALGEEKMGITGRVNTLVRTAVMLLVIFVIVRVADAATITVDSLADPGASGICALRDAITAANTESAVNGCDAGTGDDTIVFIVTGTIAIGSELPNIVNTLTIQGPAVSPPAITINGDDKFFNPWFVDSDATLDLSSVTITEIGALTNLGGTLTVTDSIFTENGTGAIGGEGSLTVSNSTFSGNSCNAGCYTIENSGQQTVTLTNSTIEHNGGFGGGGAISVDSLVVTNSSFTSNNAFFGGGRHCRRYTYRNQ
jgi:hypothetical protein